MGMKAFLESVKEAVEEEGAERGQYQDGHVTSGEDGCFKYRARD